MTPIVQFVADAFSLVHPGFLDRSDPRSVITELYHQLRKLWDKAVPVGMGLGHLRIRPLDDYSLGIEQIGESGKLDSKLVRIFSGIPKPDSDYECIVHVTFENVQYIAGVVTLVLERGRVTALKQE